VAVTGPLRVVVSAPEFPGHAFPAIALARELRSRDHEVVVETAERWRGVVKSLDLGFAAIQQYSFHPEPGDGWQLDLVEAATARAEQIRELDPDVVVSDVWEQAPQLSAELAGVPRAILMPVPYPPTAPGAPVDELGLLPPRTAVGRALWKTLGPAIRERIPSRRWLRDARPAVEAVRDRLGLPPLERPDDGAVTDGPMIVSTLPQLEYPRRWPPGVHVTGPLVFDPPGPAVKLPAGDDPLVFVASSTGSERDPGLNLIRTALEALEREPLRVVAAAGRPGRSWLERVPGNAVVIDWVPYSEVIPRASLVIAQGGQGTLARAVAEGVPVLVCPETSDMRGNGARVVWAGAGLMIPRRLLAPGTLRCSVRSLLRESRFAATAREIAAENRRDGDGAARAADLIEGHARSARPGAANAPGRRA
jgi:UDP:flavonoid glycosyltransferase YjiC (YdhE family)